MTNKHETAYCKISFPKFYHGNSSLLDAYIDSTSQLRDNFLSSDCNWVSRLKPALWSAKETAIIIYYKLYLLQPSYFASIDSSRVQSVIHCGGRRRFRVRDQRRRRLQILTFASAYKIRFFAAQCGNLKLRKQAFLGTNCRALSADGNEIRVRDEGTNLI